MLIDQISPAQYAAFLQEFPQYADAIYNGATQQLVLWGQQSTDESKAIANFCSRWELQHA